MALEVKGSLRVLIVDDHPVVREGIRMCLKDFPSLQIVGEARDGEEAVRQTRAVSPDVILLDLVMPRVSGLAAVPRIRRAKPKARVIVCTVYNTREHLRDAMAAKVDGFLLKDSSPKEYVAAIREVMEGNFFLSPAARHHMDQTRDRFGLTEREFRYLELAVKGHRAAKISRMMKCQETTVRGYRKIVFKKLGFKNMAALTRFALEKGL